MHDRHEVYGERTLAFMASKMMKQYYSRKLQEHIQIIAEIDNFVKNPDICGTAFGDLFVINELLDRRKPR